MANCIPTETAKGIPKARDLISIYYLYYYTCKDAAHQNGSEQIATAKIITDTYNNTNYGYFRGRVNALACNLAKNGSATTSQNMARECAGLALQLRGIPKKNCASPEGPGGSSFLDNLTKPPGLYYSMAALGILLIIMMKK